MTTTPNEGNVAEIRRALLEKKVRQRVAERAERERIVSVPRTGRMAIADQQRFLWFLHQMVGGAPVYNVPFAMRLRGKLDVNALSEALRGIVGRHESLRTRFGDEHGVPFQAVDPPPETWELPVIDGTEESVQDWIDQHVREEFDLRNGPPYRFGLMRLGPEDHVLSIVWQHIVIDGWSSRQFADELTARYSDPSGAQFEPITLQPADYAAWQRLWLLSDEPEKQVDYWRSSLDGMEPLEIRGDRARPSAPTGEGSIHADRLPDDLAKDIRDMAKAEGVSLLALTMAGYQVVMNRYTGQTDIALGSVLSGRTRSETEPMMGFFANAVVVRGNVDGNPVFRDLVQSTNNNIIDAMAHQDVPFGRLVEALSPERLPGRNPVVAHLFTLLPEPMIARWQLPGVDVEMLTPQPKTTRFDITFQINDLPDGGLGIWIEYSAELFDQRTIEQLVEHFKTVMADALSRPDARIDALDIMPDGEHVRVLSEWNPEPGQTDDRLLHELFAARVAEKPDAVAMRFAGEDLTYRQLDERSSALAHALVDDFKVVPGRVVGVLLERGFDLPAAELGVLKAGGAWLPLDPQYPADRLSYQLGDADVAAVVTTSDLADRLPEGVERILMDTFESQDTSTPSVSVKQEDAAYVIYTSGSTGTPKGVIVPHRAVVNFCTTFQQMFDVTPDDRILQFSNPAFDVSVSDVFSTLTAGGTIVGAPREELLDPDKLQDLLARERVTMVDIPPAVLGLLDPSKLDDLRVCFIGMEPFGPELVNKWSKPGREFHNGYGPTEVTVTCVDYLCPPEPLDGSPPIGRAMANQRAYVLDSELRPVPVGVPGELFMAGAGLAIGYLGRPDQTAEKFMPDPFATNPGERMYATGDLVRWNADGQLEFLGRVDRQVKLRGLRVELGEIEHAIESYTSVQQCVVTVQDQGTTSAWLAAYVVGEFQTDSLREHLTDRLPLHMVPTDYVQLDQLPLTSTGKIDHAKLPNPRPDGGVEQVELTTETQRRVAEIWQGLLSLDPGSIGAQDNFFLLGGNSLQVTQLVSRVRDAFQVTLDPRRLFSYPTLSQYAGQIDEAQHALLGDDEVSQLEAEIAGLSEEEIDRMLNESR
ncbi:amino acid adenylation domain-containing protein [Kibdelosporangium philippinense]|uniref:Amino acid adenylation domain-containing protein n=1 Tax=Kibdelosporangium philippinense TaxID=211113 RepID=A0ABS8Z5D7_9PSEU|nr:non-ribosomal peptide synthetase [Kibdelosporangium philippinense]MCE7003035.1 amino acid adenylation domain-containing protein [Kibdelosporangium philippinense]